MKFWLSFISNSITQTKIPAQLLSNIGFSRSSLTLCCPSGYINGVNASFPFRAISLRSAWLQEQELSKVLYISEVYSSSATSWVGNSSSTSSSSISVTSQNTLCLAPHVTLSQNLKILNYTKACDGEYVTMYTAGLLQSYSKARLITKL